MAPKTLAELETEVEVVRTHIGLILDEVVGLVEATVKIVTLNRLSKDLGTCQGQLNATLAQIQCLCKTPAEFKTYTDNIFPIIKQMNEDGFDIINELLAIKTGPAVPPPPPQSKLKLEPLKVPTFSGNFEEWQSFHDLFMSMVDKNTNLSGAEKLTYLQRALTGSASTAISSFEPTDANYKEAWDHLKTRFSIKREIVFAHIKTFEEFKPKITDPDFGLRALADALNKLIRTLKVQAIPVDQWDVILVYLALKKLDAESRKQWALDFATDLPKTKEFLDYIEKRARAFTTSPAQSKSSSNGTKPTSAHHASKGKATAKGKSCLKCSGSHYLNQCPEYKELPIHEKSKLVKSLKLCLNCLSADHKANACTSLKSCYKCGGQHHTSLHRDSATESPPVSASHCAYRGQSEQVVLLGTILVNVKDSRGLLQQCRVFVDNGSEAHFITEQCLNRLGLKKRRVHIPLNAIGREPVAPVKAQTVVRIESQTEEFSLDLNALVLPKFAGLIPAAKCQKEWNHLKKLKLSDPHFHRPHYTDILLGAAKSGHIMLPGIVSHPTNPNAPVALNTRFGWMINGESPAIQPGPTPRSVHHVSIAGDKNLDELLLKFWEQEEPKPQPHAQSSSDVDCEEHFKSTHSLNPDGTYTVQLPFRPDAPPLGHSRPAAITRFLAVEKRLNKNPSIRAEYIKSIRDYQALGYIEPVPPEDLLKPHSASYYMPHHEVVKESSTTTKVRVVFDASAKTSTKVSLNSTLHTGPKLQVDLAPLLIRFMTYPIAMSADIWKFYPQTTVHPDQRDFQRLVWREDHLKPIQDFRMARVTFGVSAAPFLAIRALHELANRVQTSHSLASHAIKHEFLVDNLLSGGHSLTQAVELKKQLLETMAIGGLKLLKFTSNSQKLLDTIPPDLLDPSALHSIDEGDFIKTIGILWNPRQDTFSVNIKVPESPLVTTKRSILSAIAKTFDPIGWLSPVTITPKILLQSLWKARLTWDKPLPLEFHQEWRRYCEKLPLLHGYSLPRNAFAAPCSSSSGITHQLHGFSDGSNLAHAACVYVRTEDSDGKALVRLLTAKTKVNPIQRSTTPRSELCGALLLANLLSTVTAAITVGISSIHCWTDSTVVLGRISPEKKLPIFELNRIRQILCQFPPHHWKHVKGEENPADAPSRGIPPVQLLCHPLWLNGPPWLQNFKTEPQPVSVHATAIAPQPVTDLLKACSSFDQMKRRVAYILRFIHNARVQKSDRRTGPLSTHELQRGLLAILKIVQAEAFSNDIENCSRGQAVRSKVKFLTPFLDQDGVLRVGGRLEHAPIPFNQKHQALLPKNHHVVDCIARHYHANYLHAGPNLLLSILREQFWPINGLYLTKRIVRRCVTCHRQQAVVATQLMGQLPFSRVNPSPTFHQTGVDYAGPFLLALRTGRKPPIVKSYVAVFICMATKATHLELVSDLSTAAFIAALTRFISRRGLPADVYSDEGTNFVGAKKELDELLRFVNSKENANAIQTFLVKKGIHFHTNPPSAPHHGGLWEAAVKSMMYHLRRVMGTRHLTIEEFTTLLCQVEAMLNSRPLTPLNNNPNEASALTPGHFLTGRPLTALPYPDLSHLPVSRLDRWQTVQCLSQNIWDSWKSNYLSLLQSRPKWYAPLPDLMPGTMVLLLDKDSSLGPQHWKLGRIVKVSPGQDGKTRVCDVRTNVTSTNPQGTILHRPVVKVSPLPIY